MRRREFLGGMAAAGGLAWAQNGAAPGRSRLSARGEFVIRDAYVMSFDPALGDLPAGDVGSGANSSRR